NMAYENPRVFLEVVHAEDRDRARGLLDQACASKSGEVEGEFRIVLPNGSLRWVRSRITPVTDAGGNVQYLVGMTEDITDRRRIEQERELAEARLVQAQKLEAIGTLAGGIAHDFNNILVAIIGYSELAMEDLPEASRARESIAEVLKAGYRARELVRQILTFSRRTQAECTTVHIPSIVKEAVKLLRSSIPSTIAIVESIDPSVPHILADPTQIHQVILNLSTNAYHAMSPSGGTLTIRVDCVDVDDGMASEHPDLKTGPHVRISVRDTGCGMDKATMSRIFDPFFTTKDPTKGTGLGLATVHGIVSSLGGAVLVTSSPGKGSTFDVYLPATPATVHAQQDTTPDIPAGNGQRILVVDDEPSILEIAASMLEQLGYRCITRASSTEAFELFRSDPACIDLVITDQTMPGMTGADLARAMLALRPDMPVILMTGFSEVMGRDEALSLGIREFIEKPFSMGDLARKVSFCLTSRG
ncbi:MAG TPA: response regulator, partial [Deltaproteobacteria bacterium]|nr:response regulator [Deltaproteobacteria bacterium]